MIKILKRIFGRKKKEVKERKTWVLAQANPIDYIGLSNIQKVKKACIEYERIGTPFTSKMIYEYLNGLVSIENVYKCMHKLSQPKYNIGGILKKVTVLCSDPKNNKHKHFYELNKNR
jgi:hypothetical protein